ncbi:MAG TPA: zinc-binding alcohol dehydrogenase family protein [Streptosporangiaceae bacterium]|nr:zinc-binding alcohol dehydrogenase family protein [Streptosporangiaceae bacterium]
MKAAVYDHPGGPEVFRYQEVPDPQLTADGVLIAVEAISVEGGDTLHRAGGEVLSVPHIVGYQAAGTVLQAGDQVRGFRPGDRVVTVGTEGSHAELRVVPERFAWHIPAGLATEVAACVPIAFGTADDALFEFGRLQPGETVLVQAGASGVGIAAIQLAKRAGAQVLATASTDEKLARLAEFGLDHGINYTQAAFHEAVRHLTGGRGADVFLDTVGGQTLRASLRCLAYRGRCVSIGDAGRHRGMSIDVSTLRPNNQSLTGYFLGAELFFGNRAHHVIAGRLDDIAAGSLRVVIDRIFPLADASAAHAYIESRQAFGRVLLKP